MSVDNNKNQKSGLLDAFSLCEASLKRFIGRFIYRPDDINDMAQETFLRAYSALNNREIDSPKAYLFKVAKTIALKELARKSRQLTDYIEESQEKEVCEEVTLEENIGAEQKIRLYCDAIAELPPQCRRVFLMRKVQALSHKEIAQTLNISLSAVEKQIAIGVERCKNYVEIQEKGGGEYVSFNKSSKKS